MKNRYGFAIIFIIILVGSTACHILESKTPYAGEPLVVTLTSPTSNQICTTNITVSGTLSDTSSISSIIAFIKTADNTQTNFVNATVSGLTYNANITFTNETNCVV